MKLTDAAATPGAAPRVAQGTGQSRQLEARAEEVAAVQDKVSVPPTPAENAAAVQVAQATVADARTNRVQEIINAVRSGQYYPSPQQIAQRLVSEAEVEARVRALMAR